MSWRMFVLDESLDISNAYHSIARAKQHALHRHSIPAYRRRFADKCARRLGTVANLRHTERLGTGSLGPVAGPQSRSHIFHCYTDPDGARILRHVPARTCIWSEKQIQRSAQSVVRVRTACTTLHWSARFSRNIVKAR